MKIVNIIGYSAGALTVITFLPQTFKTVSTHVVDGLSVWTYSILILEVFLWATYGIMSKNKVILYTNIPILVMAFLIVYNVLKYG